MGEVMNYQKMFLNRHVTYDELEPITERENFRLNSYPPSGIKFRYTIVYHTIIFGSKVSKF